MLHAALANECVIYDANVYVLVPVESSFSSNILVIKIVQFQLIILPIIIHCVQKKNTHL